MANIHALARSHPVQRVPFAGRFDHTTERALADIFAGVQQNLELVVQITATNLSFIRLSRPFCISSPLKKWNSFTFCVRRPLIWA